MNEQHSLQIASALIAMQATLTRIAITLDEIAKRDQGPKTPSGGTRRTAAIKRP